MNRLSRERPWRCALVKPLCWVVIMAGIGLMTGVTSVVGQANAVQKSDSSLARPCCQAVARTADSSLSLQTKTAGGIDELVSEGHKKGANYPLATNSAAIFFTVMFGIMGILIGILALLRGDDKIFKRIKTYRDKWMLRMTLVDHFAAFILVSTIYTLAVLLCFLTGIEEGAWYKIGIIIWVGGFLHLMLRMTFFVLH